MSGFDEPHHIDFVKRQLNKLCSSISQEHGFRLREMLILFFADTALGYVVQARDIRHTFRENLKPSH